MFSVLQIGSREEDGWSLYFLLKKMKIRLGVSPPPSQQKHRVVGGGGDWKGGHPHISTATEKQRVGVDQLFNTFTPQHLLTPNEASGVTDKGKNKASDWGEAQIE